MRAQTMYHLTQPSSIGIVKLKLTAGTDGRKQECVFVDVNSVFEKLTGLKRAAVIGRKVTEVLPWIADDAFDWTAFINRSAASGEVQETLRFIAALGRRCRVMAYSYAAAHILLGIEDKTREVQMNEELVALGKYREMFEKHPAVMLLCAPLTAKVLQANDAACDFYGYSKEEFQQISLSEICPHFEETFQKCISSQGTRSFSLMEHRLKNGETRAVEVYSSPVRIGDEIECLSVVIDVTSREKCKQDLYEKEALLSITLNSIGDGVVTTDKDGLITLLNKSAQEITGWDVEKALNRDITKLFRIKDETGQTVDDPVSQVLRTGNMVERTSHIFLRDNEGVPILIADSAAPIRDEQGNIFGAVMVFRDVSQDIMRQEKIRYLSRHDPLTGLYNRSYVMEIMRYIDTPEHLPITVIIGDVNGLKLVNDAFGHEKGDGLLKKVASVLRISCRSDDIIARWGEDEFLILLPNTPSAAAEGITQRLCRNFDENNDGGLRFSVSLGYAAKQEASQRIEDVIAEAEKRMSHKKLLEEQSYRNTIINTLLATLYERNIEAEEHSTRLDGYCLAVARKMGLSPEQTDELSLLAILHDIGKVGINQNILQKPGPLSDEEWEEMQKHCEIGQRIVKHVNELSSVAEYILQHHERWDGTGYPNGRAGEEIPLVCRILAVVDAYDVMINGRIYKEACTKEEAIAELRRNAGTQFDPDVVELFIEAISQEDELTE